MISVSLTHGVHKDMNISEGGAAQAAYFEMLAADPQRLKQIRKDLLEYCKQDTWAMVRLWEELQRVA